MIPKRFKIRHKVLEILVEHYNKIYNETSGQTINAKKLNIPINQILEKLSVSEKFLRLSCSKLVNDNELEYDYDHELRQETMRLAKNGIEAYIEKKYILFGQKLRLDIFYDYFKIISGILLLGIALFTFIVNVITTRNNEKAIKSLQEQVDKLMLKQHKVK